MVRTRIAYSVFMNYKKQTDFNQDGIEQVGTKQGAKKYQDGIGTDKPLLDGLVVKTLLAYSVFMNYEKQNDFNQAGIKHVGTKQGAKKYQDGSGPTSTRPVPSSRRTYTRPGLATPSS